MGNCVSRNNLGKFPETKENLHSEKIGITDLNNKDSNNADNNTSQDRSCWIQLAGHQDSFVVGSKRTILKLQPGDHSPEIIVYRALMLDVNINHCIPKFYGVVDKDDKKYIELEDLLQHFNHPNAVDIKIGIRTFKENEVKHDAPRSDLYEKMLNQNSAELSELEHQRKSVTKLRYMKFRETGSSTENLGFRIEGIKVVSIISKFIKQEVSISKKFSQRLKEIRNCFENSQLFQYYEVIGSSLFLVYDDIKADGWMIDFGKTSRVNHKVNHRLAWTLGSHEDGYLTGLDNLIQIMDEISENSKFPI